MCLSYIHFSLLCSLFYSRITLLSVIVNHKRAFNGQRGRERGSSPPPSRPHFPQWLNGERRSEVEGNGHRSLQSLRNGHKHQVQLHWSHFTAKWRKYPSHITAQRLSRSSCLHWEGKYSDRSADYCDMRNGSWRACQNDIKCLLFHIYVYGIFY